MPTPVLGDFLLSKGTSTQPALGFITSLGVTGLWLDETGGLPAVVVQVGGTSAVKIKAASTVITGSLGVGTVPTHGLHVIAPSSSLAYLEALRTDGPVYLWLHNQNVSDIWGFGVDHSGGFGAHKSGSGPWVSVSTGLVSSFANTPLVGVNTIWHAGNDGASSGLDADLLDGQHASYYLDTSSSTQVKSGNITLGSGVGTLRLTAGTSSPDRPGYIGFHTADGTRRGYIGWTDGSSHLLIANENGWSWSFTNAPLVGSNTIWHAGNDGSGTGLDADLLDGNHASAFALSGHNHSGVYEPVFSKGDLVQGSGVTLTGTLTGRLVGSGNVTITATGTGVTDHGALTGLGDDDHTQYFNTTRGDARYLQLAGGTISGALYLTGIGADIGTAGSYRFLMRDPADNSVRPMTATYAKGYLDIQISDVSGLTTALSGKLSTGGGTLSGGLIGTTAQFTGLTVTGNTSLTGGTVTIQSASSGTVFSHIAGWISSPAGGVVLNSRTVVEVLSDMGGVSTSRTISAGTGLSGGGDLSANRTISIASTGVSATSYGASSGQSVPYFTVNAQGQLTAAGSRNMTAADLGTAASIVFVTTSEVNLTGTNLTGTSYVTILGSIRSGFSSTLSANALATGYLLRIELMGVMRGNDGYVPKIRVMVGSSLTVEFQVNEPESNSHSVAVPWNAVVQVLVTAAGSSATTVCRGHFEVQNAPAGESWYTVRTKPTISGTLNTTTTNAIAVDFRGGDTNMVEFKCSHAVAWII